MTHILHRTNSRMNKLNPLVVRLISLITLVCSSGQLTWAQEGQTIYSSQSKTRTIDHSEYNDIKGSPYIYDKWVSARILGTDGIFFDFEKVNFNGFSHQLEVKTDGVTEEIIPDSFLKAIIETSEGKNTFMRGIHPDLGQNIICILYDGNKVKLIKKFDVRIEESVSQTPGVPTVFTKFATTKEYYIMLERNLSKTKLKKKSVISILNFKSQLENYIKQEKLNLNKESDMVLLLTYYELTLLQ